MTIDENKDDADFEAFLRGEGELAEGMQALAQPSPSATLDAAVLARARADLERDARNARLQRDAQRAREANEARGQAANDPPPRARWGLPGGIAATVLAGVLGHQLMNHNADVERAAMAPPRADEQQDAASVAATAAAAAPAAVDAPKPVPLTEKKSAPIVPPASPAAARATPAPTLAMPVPSPARSPAAPAAPRAATLASPAPSPAAPAASPAPPPAPLPAAVEDAARDVVRPAVPPAAYSSAAAPSARADKGEPARYSAPVFERAPAQVAAPVLAPPAPAPAAAPATEAVGRVAVTGSRNRTLSSAVGADDPDDWLKRISALLARGDKDRALVEWRNFRAIHPDYPVAEPLASAIKAAQE